MFKSGKEIHFFEDFRTTNQNFCSAPQVYARKSMATQNAHGKQEFGKKSH